MSNHSQIVKLIKSISGQANVLTIPRVFITLTKGSHRAALVLSQCVYWSDRSNNPEGWFYKTHAEWKGETGIPRGGIDTALKLLEAWVETKVIKVGGTPKNHYRVNLDALVKDLMAQLEPEIPDLSESSKSDLSETDNSDLSESNKSSIAKTTTKITGDVIAVSLDEWFGKSPTPPENPKTQALITGTEEHRKIIPALETLTGRKIDPKNKTAAAQIAELREWGATPAACAHFSHYWQVVEKWRGEHAKPSLKDVWERWGTAQNWQPEYKAAVSPLRKVYT